MTQEPPREGPHSPQSPQSPQSPGQAPPPQYGPPQQHYGPPPAQQGGGTNGMAIAALVLGIIGLLLSWTVFLAILSVLAVIFGILGRNRAKREPHVGGGGMALAGLICGIIGVLIGLVVLGFSIFAADEISNDLEDLNQELEQLEDQSTTP